MAIDNNHYRIIVESSPNMIWRSGKDALCNYFNTTWLQFTGHTMEEEDGNGWTLGVHPDDFDNCVRIYLEAFNKRESFEMEYRLKRHDGKWRWINDRGVPIFDENSEFQGFIGSCMDVTDKVEGARLREMAQQDGLTGMFNRQYFEQLARVQLQESIEKKENLFFIMIDVDKMKRINDAYGHQAGDLILKEVARALKSSIKETDLLGRYGGDEFVIVLRGILDAEAMTVIESCKSAVREKVILYNGHEIRTSISIGFKKRDTETDFEKLLEEADKEMYEQKQAL